MNDVSFSASHSASDAGDSRRQRRRQPVERKREADWSLAQGVKTAARLERKARVKGSLAFARQRRAVVQRVACLP